MVKVRADRLLVSRGLFDSRTSAQAAIEAGNVTADGLAVTKASQMLPGDAALKASAAHPFVSRGGVKLAAALEHFRIDPRDKVCLDVGASTGGFTDALLRAGARMVCAVDVGTDQLSDMLRCRPDVIVMEKTDIRSLSRARLPDIPELITVDLSFISLKLVIPVISALAASRAILIALVKPQFEAGRKALKKGLVRDRAVHLAVCDEIETFLTEQGWQVNGIIESPILGGDGNREFLLCAERKAASGTGS